MHLNKIIFTSSVLILVLCAGAAISSKTHRRMRSDRLRVFSLRQRKLTGHGRSMDTSSTVVGPSVDEGRGFMKKLMLFRNLFQQPESNIIIITQQPTTTATTPTTSPTTTPATTATAAATTFAAGRLDSDLRQNNDLINTGNTMKRINNPNRRFGNNAGRRKRRRNQLQRNQNRIRLEHTADNFYQKPSPAANIYSINSSGSNNNSLNNNNTNNNNNNIGTIPTPGGLSFNTNARIQSLMNALRQQQTSVVYN